MEYNIFSESLSAVSIMLVFVIMLFNLSYPKINSDLNIEKPRKELILDCEKEKKRLKGNLLKKYLPQTIIHIVISYLFLPSAIYIFGNYPFSIWDFDLLVTLHLGIVGAFWWLAIWSVILIIKMIKKINSIVH